MIYLDSSATSPVHEEVLEAMLPYLREEYGNPSSKYYLLADNAKKAVELAREKVAQLLGCEADEVIFTSGSTESNNMILKGILDYIGPTDNQHDSPSIVTSVVEHPSVLETCRYLESKNIFVKYLPTDQYGRIVMDDIKKELDEKKYKLVSVIWGNNELGSLNNIESVAKLCHEKNIFFHTDATQVVGKIPIHLKLNPGIRFLSLSAHKMSGPKGVGACFIRKETNEIYTKWPPLLHGGGQENNYRSGTLAVHNIVGLGKAAELAKKNLDRNSSLLSELESYFIQILKNKFKDLIKINNDVQKKIPGVLSIQFIGINNELLIKKLSPYVACSSGSACSSAKPSHVLSAVGLSLDEIRQTIRFSLHPGITKDDLDFFQQLN